MSNYNINSGYGQALLHGVRSVVPTFGRVFVVMNSSNTDEENYTRIQDVFPPDPNGQVRFFTSLASAYDATESNNNDVIVLDGNSTHTLTAELDISKNRVHIVGMDYLMGLRRRYGHSSKISIGITTDETISAIKITGVRCSLRGVKVMSSNTEAESIFAVADGGEYTYMDCVEIFKSTDVAVAGAADLLCNGDSSHYRRCYIGNTATAISATGARPCVLFNRETITGKVARDVTFEDCIFARKCGSVNNTFFYGSGATDIERLNYVKGCLFYNNLLASADPDEGIEFASSQTEGSMILSGGCASVSTTKLCGTTGVFSADPAGSAQGGESIQMS